jgi:site-specific DNA-methyltransferase (adenine-specific)
MKTEHYNKIYNEDCLVGMDRIDDNSVDMILCDPPYGTTQNKWDCILPLDKLWNQYTRIIKSNGAIVLMGRGLFSAKLILSNEGAYRYTLIWEKTRAGGFLNARRMPLQSHEDILIFYKKLPVYNPQMQEGKPYVIKSISNGDGRNYGKFERIGKTYKNDGDRFPRSVIRISNDNHNSLHPTQKPVELFEYLIKTYSNEGDVVLDNCMGSGTTAIACINTNRRYIGFELDPEYFRIAQRRINEN